MPNGVSKARVQDINYHMHIMALESFFFNFFLFLMLYMRWMNVAHEIKNNSCTTYAVD